MRIVPSGQKREMVAQSFSEAAPDFNNDILGALTGMGAEAPSLPAPNNGDQSLDPESLDPESLGLEKEEEPTQKEADIKEYVFKKLEAFGYPPRRLEEFEDDFVTEKIYPGEAREVVIVMPDRYYGTRKSISSGDFKKIIQEIQSQFGLSFVEAERKDKRIEIKFSSQTESDVEEEPVADELDEIYGGGAGKGGGKKKAKGKPKQIDPAKASIAGAEESSKKYAELSSRLNSDDISDLYQKLNPQKLTEK